MTTTVPATIMVIAPMRTCREERQSCSARAATAGTCAGPSGDPARRDGEARAAPAGVRRRHGTAAPVGGAGPGSAGPGSAPTSASPAGRSVRVTAPLSPCSRATPRTHPGARVAHGGPAL